VDNKNEIFWRFLLDFDREINLNSIFIKTEKPVNTSKMNNPIKRITKILLGSGIYWVGYCGFFTHQQNIVYSSLSMLLIISGLLVAGWNSSNLYKGQ